MFPGQENLSVKWERLVSATSLGGINLKKEDSFLQVFLVANGLEFKSLAAF